MAGTRIETGDWTPHDTTGATGNVLHPLDPSATPGVQAPTVTAGLQTPADQGPVFDGTADFASQASSGTAVCASAMHAGMSAENDRRSHYQGPAVSPPGDTIGDVMTLASGYPDSGTVGGLTQPFGYFYDPPRAGAPETFQNRGNEP